MKGVDAITLEIGVGEITYYDTLWTLAPVSADVEKCGSSGLM